MLIDPAKSFLLIVDMQEKLVPAVLHHESIVANIGGLAMAADRLGVPTFATEHCADRIGHTVPDLAQHLPADQVLAKTHFCAMKEPSIVQRLGEMGRSQVVICGAEAHVCVLQSALGLRELGYEVFLVADASGSRHRENRLLAQERLRQAGGQVASSEMVIFEWLQRADQAVFRTLLPVIKGLRPLE